MQSQNYSGYIHIYTGNGKGKTTAALGLALRAAGAGMRIYIGQFLKGQSYAELEGVKMFGTQLCIEQFGQTSFYKLGNGDLNAKSCAQKGFQRVQKIIQNNEYDIVILDEINVAVSLDLIRQDQVLDLMNLKPAMMELIMTGRGASQAIIEQADLVTEMRDVKHYYHQGVMARKGIEH